MKKLTTFIVLGIIINLIVLAISYLGIRRSDVSFTYYGPSGICQTKSKDCCVDGEICKVSSKTHEWIDWGIPVFLERTKINILEQQWIEGEKSADNNRYAAWGFAPKSATSNERVENQYKFNFVNLILHIVYWFGLSAVLVAIGGSMKKKKTKDLIK